MYDAAIVGGMQRLADLHQEIADTLGMQYALLFQNSIEANPRNMFHHDARAARIVNRGIEEFDGVRVPKPRHDLHLALKQFAEARLIGDPLAHHLDYNIALLEAIAGAPDLAHAATAYRFDDFVAIQNDAPEHVSPL
jgi:hypothetical protein